VCAGKGPRVRRMLGTAYGWRSRTPNRAGRGPPARPGRALAGRETRVRRETLHGGGWGIPSGRRLGVGAGAGLGGAWSRGAYPQKPAVCLGL
jgi:hypothetical protein